MLNVEVKVEDRIPHSLQHSPFSIQHCLSGSKRMKRLDHTGARRRKFLKAVPAAVASGLALPALAQPPRRSRPAASARTSSSAARKSSASTSPTPRKNRRSRESTAISTPTNSFAARRCRSTPSRPITFRPYLPGRSRSRAPRRAQMELAVSRRATVRVPRGSTISRSSRSPRCAARPAPQRCRRRTCTKMYLERLKATARS